MAHAWDMGGMEAVGNIMASANVEPNNHHLWAVVGDLANHLPASDRVAKALAGIKRSSATIATFVASGQNAIIQTALFDTAEA